MKNGLLSLITAISCWAAAAAATSERPMLIRVDLKNYGAFDILSRFNFDVAFVGRDGFADIVGSDEDYQELDGLGLRPFVIHNDLISYYQSRFPATTTMGGFRTFSEAIAYLDTIHTLFPTITTSRSSIGNSYEGRPLWMMKISDNPEIDEDEPEFLINGLTHAREPMGMEATLSFMRYLCDNYGSNPEVTNLVDNREFYFVPIVNPDGYEYNRLTDPSGGGMWRKNRRGNGTDLNRNWGYMWGYDNDGSSPYPSDETYRGTGPFSEPETQALRLFINQRDFNLAMNFHTYGNYFLYPWGYDDLHAPDQPIFAIIADSSTASNGYAAGTPWELLYNTNGDANDWQYGEQTEKPKIFAFTMEIGEQFDGFWPDPYRIPILWQDVLPSLLYLSRIADNPMAAGPPVAPNLAGIGVVPGDFTIYWQHHDQTNPAVAFELIELTGLQRMADNFDAGTANWNLDGFYRVNNRHHSGAYAIYSGSDNSYDGSIVAVNPIQVGPNDTLSFWTWYAIELDYDYAYAQISSDGGATFDNLAGNVTTNYNPNGTNLGNGITGSSGAWILAKFPLHSYAGQSVVLGLRYRTDVGVLEEGFYADDLYPVETFVQQTIIGSAITDTLYAFDNHPEGEYYYQVRACDAQGQWSGRSNRQMATVEAGPACIFTPGDINGNGVFNGIDVTYGVSYLKGQGDPPAVSCDCPPHGTLYPAADVNGNCLFNGIDIIYAVSFLKSIGAPPASCPDCQ